jgi:hypothetical protein
MHEESAPFPEGLVLVPVLVLMAGVIRSAV